MDTPLLADASTAATLPAHLEGLAETARDYAKASSSDNTRKAYASDWLYYTGWARRHGLPPALPADPQVSGLYIVACASGTAGPNSARRPQSSAGFRLKWNFAQRSENFDRKNRHVATVLAGIRSTQGQPPEQKEAVLPEDLLAMIATLDLGDLRGPARPGDPAFGLHRRPAALRMR